MDIKSGVSPANHITSETAVDVSDLRLKHLVCSIVLPARQATCRSTPYVYAKRTEGGDGDGTAKPVLRQPYPAYTAVIRPAETLFLEAK